MKRSLVSAMKKLAEAEEERIKANIQLTEAMKSLRSHHNLSQEQIAHIMGVSPMYVSLLERKKRQWSYKTVRRLIDPLFSTLNHDLDHQPSPLH